MKLSSMAAALALGLAASSGGALAQGTKVVETRITVGSMEPGPQSPEAARKEAAAALAQAKSSCRHEDRQAQRACMEAAREDYRNLMETARQRSG